MAAALALTIQAPAALADPDELANPRIVNGIFTWDYPTVGALLTGPNPDSADSWCSGTMIGCETFLTAAHCVAGQGPEDFFVFLPNAGIFAVQSVAFHTAYDFPIADVAVLKLTTPVNGVSPSVINTINPPPFSSAGTIVGYGRSGGGNFDYGLKRAGDVSTQTCAGAPNDGSDASLVCWRFESPIGPPGDDSNTCNADSGGPLFIDLGTGPVIAGLTSGGTSPSCQPSDFSYDANVYTYRSFVQTEGGADLANTSCGALPQVGGSEVAVFPFTGSVSSATPQATHAFNIPIGTTVLRVAMNAVDDGSDFDLYVKAGSPPTTEVFDCRRNGSGQYGVCEFLSPTPGAWHLLVRRFTGSGPYQITATAFGLDCSLPENDGLACDDSNGCTTAETCQLGACTGTSVADGTPCSDGNPCSQPDVCTSGMCSGAAPATSCKQPIRAKGASLKVFNRDPDTRDKLVWRWRGEETVKPDFGTPRTTTPYALCVYDEVAGTPVRRILQEIPPGLLWTDVPRGFNYRDSSLTVSGIQSIRLAFGSDGKASASVVGKSGALGLPALPFTQQSSVIVQLLNGSKCWEATYSTSDVSNELRFRAKSD